MWIKKENYDVKSRVEEIRALLANTSCKECLNENYIHSTRAHQEFAQLQKEEEEKQAELEKQTQQTLDVDAASIADYQSAQFASFSASRDFSQVDEIYQQINELTEQLKKMTSTTTITIKEKVRQITNSEEETSCNIISSSRDSKNDLEDSRDLDDDFEHDD